MAVAATTDLDRPASFSDFGDWVDVSAPGISVYSTIPGGYGYMSGTSMASPFVSGLAALLFSQLSDTNGNGLLNDEVRSRIESTADNIGLAGIGSAASTPTGGHRRKPALAAREHVAAHGLGKRDRRSDARGHDWHVDEQSDELRLPVAALRQHPVPTASRSSARPCPPTRPHPPMPARRSGCR
jgi:hypothetical protein